MDDDPDRAAQSAKRPFVQLGPDLGRRPPDQQPDGLARIAQGEGKKPCPPVAARVRVADHRAAAIINLALLAGGRRDDHARLDGSTPTQAPHEAADTRIAGRKTVVADQVLVDGDGVAPLGQGGLDALAERLAGAGRRRPARWNGVGRYRPRGGRVCCGRVGGHLPAPTSLSGSVRLGCGRFGSLGWTGRSGSPGYSPRFRAGIAAPCSGRAAARATAAVSAGRSAGATAPAAGARSQTCGVAAPGLRRLSGIFPVIDLIYVLAYYLYVVRVFGRRFTPSGEGVWSCKTRPNHRFLWKTQARRSRSVAHHRCQALSGHRMRGDGGEGQRWWHGRGRGLLRPSSSR